MCLLIVLIFDFRKVYKMSCKICFIGAGNLATQLSAALHKCGHSIIQVYSKTKESASALANKLNCDYTTSTQEISTKADMYIVALKDSVLNEVLSEINFQNKLLVHCSGSLPISVLNTYSKNTGVFYPLQTFSKSREVNFKKIPVFVEANSDSNQTVLLEMGRLISENVSFLDSEKRKALHIAAVWACNFVNHMYTMAAEFLETKDIPFEVLQPLITETASKVMEMQPKEAQTGPAVRFDENIIYAHLEQFKEFPGHHKLYNSISKSIFELHQEKKK